MEWLAPGAWAWALTLPVIVALYFLRRKYQDQTVSSILLWQNLQREQLAHHPWRRLQRHQLLLWQLLAAALLVLALVRPAIPTEGVSASHTVVLVDVSASMGAKEGEGTRLEAARDKVEQLIASLGPGQTMTLVAVSDAPRVVAARSRDRQDLGQALESLTPRPVAADPAGALSLAQALSREEGTAVVWVGDQAPDGQGFTFIPVGSPGGNGTVAAFTVEAGGRGLARVENRGTEGVTGRLVLEDAQGRSLAVHSLTLAPGQVHSQAWDNLPPSPYYRAKLQLEGDLLPGDDEAWAVVAPADKPQGYLMTEAGRFLEQALMAGGRIEVIKQEGGGAPEALAPLFIYEGPGPDTWPEGNFLWINPYPSPWFNPGTPQGAGPLEVAEPGHPLLAHVNLEGVYIRSIRNLTPPAGWITLVRSGGLPLLMAGEAEGRRGVVLNLDLAASDLALRPPFPILMQNALDWLLPPQGSFWGSASPGQAWPVPLGVSQGGNMVTPSGQTLDLTGVGVITLPDETGLYRLQTAGGEEGYLIGEFPREETYLRAGRAELAAVPGAPGAFASGRLEIWPYLAALALGVTLWEWRVYRRGY